MDLHDDLPRAEKTCTKCGETKHLKTGFPRNKRTRDGRSSWCRECHNKASECHNKARALDPHHVTRTSWENLRRRCYDANAAGWASHGGQGVTVCERWLLPNGVGFKNFLADLGPRPIDEPATSRTRTSKTIYQTLGRYRDEGNYEPGNCEWMTQERQERHKGPRAGSSSRFKGVKRRKSKWRAAINIADVYHHLGCFDVEEDAARAYDRAARNAWGEDCYLNMI